MGRGRQQLQESGELRQFLSRDDRYIKRAERKGERRRYCRWCSRSLLPAPFVISRYAAKGQGKTALSGDAGESVRIDHGSVNKRRRWELLSQVVTAAESTSGIPSVVLSASEGESDGNDWSAFRAALSDDPDRSALANSPYSFSSDTDDYSGEIDVDEVDNYDKSGARCAAGEGSAFVNPLRIPVVFREMNLKSALTLAKESRQQGFILKQDARDAMCDRSAAISCIEAFVSRVPGILSMWQGSRHRGATRIELERELRWAIADRDVDWETLVFWARRPSTGIHLAETMLRLPSGSGMLLCKAVRATEDKHDEAVAAEKATARFTHKAGTNGRSANHALPSRSRSTKSRGSSGGDGAVARADSSDEFDGAPAVDTRDPAEPGTSGQQQLQILDLQADSSNVVFIGDHIWDQPTSSEFPRNSRFRASVVSDSRRGNGACPHCRHGGKVYLKKRLMHRRRKGIRDVTARGVQGREDIPNNRDGYLSG